MIRVEGLLVSLIPRAATLAMLEAMSKIWNDGIGETYSDLKMPGLCDFITG